MDPILLFFLLGLGAGLLRAELRLPSAIYDFVSMLLLLWKYCVCRADVRESIVFL